MKISRLSRYALSASATAAALTNCSGPQLPTASYGVLTPSWASRAAHQKVIYVAGIYPNSVSVYSWHGKPLKTLKISYSPRGLCNDKNGDLYVVDTAGAKIVEYAAEGSRRIRTLKDSGQRPAACSVDPNTGNLAVTNSKTTSSGTGSVAIYTKAMGKPKLYTNSGLTVASYCGYDDKSDLFVDGVMGQPSPGNVWFGELPAGQDSLLQIKVDRKIEEPGEVQRIAPYVTIGALYFDTIYRLTVSGDKAKVAGTTKLKGAEVVNSWIQGTKVIAGTIIFTSVPGKVEVWNYPAGGKPIKSFGNAQFTNAVTVSIAPRQ
jgi:hypothetical protein